MGALNTLFRQLKGSGVQFEVVGPQWERLERKVLFTVIIICALDKRHLNHFQSLFTILNRIRSELPLEIQSLHIILNSLSMADFKY